MINRFSQVMGEIEKDLGTKDLNALMLNAIRDALQNCRIATVESLKKQMEELIHIFNNTEPRYAIVIYNMYTIYDGIRDLLQESDGRHDYKQYRKKIVRIVDRIIKKSRQDKRAILHNAESINVDGKTVLIHDHSHTVQDVLHHLRRKGQRFRVIVAEQDMDKTLSNIELLTEHKIPFQVVPAHMLSNIENEIDMCFFGALTLKSTYDFVVDTGTNAIISEFHLQRTPIYFFLSSTKFALWKARKKEAVKRNVHTRKHPCKKIHFERFKFSHDRVPLSSVDFTVTEEGIFKPHELKKLYQEKFRAHAELTKEMSKI